MTSVNDSRQAVTSSPDNGSRSSMRFPNGSET
jgi:hypothetical protein